MKKYFPVATSVIVLAGMLNAGCEEDSRDFTSDESACKTEGFVRCGKVCINPMTSKQYCGANVYCEGYEVCINGQTCQNGTCIDHSQQPQTCTQDKCDGWCGDFNTDSTHCGNCKTKCNPDEYCENGKCASTSSCTQDKCGDWCGDFMNDPNHCGNCDTDCTKIATSNGVCKQGQCQSNVVTCNPPCNDDQTCQNGQCKPIECPDDQHLFNGSCEPDSVEHCGKHGYTCANEVDGWQDGECSRGQCVVSSCAEYYHLYEGSCEPDSVEHCGKHNFDCSQIDGFGDGKCVEHQCVATACIQNYHLYQNTCEPDDENHCATHTTNCHDIRGYKTGECIDGECMIDTCVDGYHLDSANNRCVADTNDCCGTSCERCSSPHMCSNGACENVCGNGELNEGEPCDGMLFDKAVLSMFISTFMCSEGDVIIESAVSCTEDCALDADNACFDRRFVLFSEVVPSLENAENAVFLGGLALELTNMGIIDASLDSCGLFMTNSDGTSTQTWSFSDLGLTNIDAGESVVVCIQKANESNFGSACDYRINESSLKTVVADKRILAIQCNGKLLDIFNLSSFTSAIRGGVVDFIRHCDALPVYAPENALLGKDWRLETASAHAPAYGLGEHCGATGSVITSCTYTANRYTLTDRSQMIELTLDVKIPGITDKTPKTDASGDIIVAFYTGNFGADDKLSPQNIHQPIAFADTNWTNDDGIDRYIGAYHNWDTYEGFLDGEDGTYTMDAGISFDNGHTWTYCGPKGIISDYSVYDASERNTLVVKYEMATCGDGNITGAEVCDGDEFINVLYCGDPHKTPINITKEKCYSCMTAMVEATCGD